MLKMDTFEFPLCLICGHRLQKSGSHLFCVHIRELKSITKFDAEPAPHQKHLFTRLNNAKYLFTTDLSKGSWQVPMAPEERQMSTFVTHDGLFEWNVMPFGLSNSGAIFLRNLLAPDVKTSCRHPKRLQQHRRYHRHHSNLG